MSHSWENRALCITPFPRAGRGKGTAALVANILQHIMDMRKEFLFKVFLDLLKGCLRSGEGLKPSCRVRGWSQDGLTYSDVLGLTDHGSKGWRVLWTPVQGVPRCQEGQPPVPHNIQHGCGRRHPPLGDCVDTIRGGQWGTLSDDHRPGDILIC